MKRTRKSNALVGVLGASGAIGREATRMLRGVDAISLRLGGRRLDAIECGDDEAMAVDANDPESLATFCEGCRLVLNSAGPSHALGDRIARAAWKVGADYVDVCGYTAYDQLAAADPRPEDRRAVLLAGMWPGLSTILPRWLAKQGFATLTRLTVYIGGGDRLTPAAAGDILASLDTGGRTRERERPSAHSAWYGEASAAWRCHRWISGALRTAEDIELPCFPGLVTTLPFLNSDSERLATALSLPDLEWYHVFSGKHLHRMLAGVRGPAASSLDMLRLAEEAVRASELDLAGRQPHFVMLFALEGWNRHQAMSRTAILSTPNTAELSAAVGVLAVRAALEGRIPPGVHFADEVLDPAYVMEGVQRLATEPTFHTVEGALGLGAASVRQPVFEQGAL